MYDTKESLRVSSGAIAHSSEGNYGRRLLKAASISVEEYLTFSCSISLQLEARTMC